MSFLAGERLLLLLGVAALLVGYLLAQRRRAVHAVRFSTLPLLRSVNPRSAAWRRHVSAAAFLLMLALAVTAFARPARDVQVPRERASVVLAIDVSISMEATDVAPSRIAAAKSAAQSFVDAVPARLNLGLVSFSGSAQVLVPPTRDREAVRAAVRALRLGPRTAVGEAVFTSLEAIRAVPGEPGQEPAPGSIVLMSDGETTVGRPDSEAATEARRAGVPVSTIAFGTDAGVVVTEGVRVPVPVNRAALQSLAERTRGSAFEAASQDELRRVYEDVGTSIGYQTEQRETWPVPLGLALLAGTVAAVTSLVWSAGLP